MLTNGTMVHSAKAGLSTGQNVQLPRGAKSHRCKPMYLRRLRNLPQLHRSRISDWSFILPSFGAGLQKKICIWCKSNVRDTILKLNVTKFNLIYVILDRRRVSILQNIERRMVCSSAWNTNLIFLVSLSN